MTEVMRYAEVTEPGGPEQIRLKTGPKPEPRPGEVVIRVMAAGVNRPDLLQRAGKYPPPPDASPVLGLEVAGEITALGLGVTDWRLGDAVCALTPGGGYAGFCRVPAGQCVPVPKGFSFEEAASLPETYFTVWTNVFDRGRLRAGETFLVHGGSSGIGVAAIQLAREFGARVACTAGTEAKCAACRELGATLAVNYRERDFVEEVKLFTEGKGVNLILDMVGAPYFPRNMEALSPDGRLVQIAVQSGAVTELNLAKLLVKRLTLTGSALRPLPVPRKAAIALALRKQVWPLLEARKVRPVIDRVFSFEEVAEAHRYLEAGQHVGKVVLKM